jgi:multidrug resistance efflux pump
MMSILCQAEKRLEAERKEEERLKAELQALQAQLKIYEAEHHSCTSPPFVYGVSPFSDSMAQSKHRKRS